MERQQSLHHIFGTVLCFMKVLKDEEWSSEYVNNMYLEREIKNVISEQWKEQEYSSSHFRYSFACYRVSMRTGWVKLCINYVSQKKEGICNGNPITLKTLRFPPYARYCRVCYGVCKRGERITVYNMLHEKKNMTATLNIERKQFPRLYIFGIVLCAPEWLSGGVGRYNVFVDAFQGIQNFIHKN